MSAKKKRINSIFKIKNTLNHPLTGAGKNAQRCSYSKDTILLLMEELENLLKAEGLSMINVDGKQD